MVRSNQFQQNSKGWGCSSFLYKEFDFEIRFLLYIEQLMEIDSKEGLNNLIVCDPNRVSSIMMEDEGIYCDYFIDPLRVLDNLFPYLSSHVLLGCSRKHVPQELL